MRQEGEIIELADWLSTPAGRYLLDWEQQQIDACVADVFGFHALQVGLPQLDALRANRMPHRWMSTDATWSDVHPAPPQASEVLGALHSPALHCHFHALPFPAASLDLVVLPHALELAHDPHRALAEVERVLVPEGRVVIAGLNPTSLWGLRQRCGRVCRHFPGVGRDLFLPNVGEFMGYRRLRDWLRLLSFEIEGGRFGCYRPPVRTQRWLDRFLWMEATGQHWWPVFGAAYVLVAVKRVRGMRLIGLPRRERSKPQPAPAVVANRHRNTESV